MTAPTRKRLAFIDHSFHQSTRSSDFFQEVLRRDYEVAVFFDDGWRGGPEVDPQTVNEGNFDVVLFWQVLPNTRSLLRFCCDDLLWVPMYDNERERSSLGWRALSLMDMKVICFSKALYEVTQRVGIHSFQVQYFPEPSEKEVSYGRARVFFWQRINEMGWPLLKQILGDNDVEKVVLRDDPDPSHEFAEPEAGDVEKFGIEVIRNLKVAGGGRYEDYMRLLSGCNVFVAPRLSEGIGLSFLEAMALGMCVVAPDAPTMNEYISTDDNGFLFDPEDAGPVALSHFEECGRRARARVARGREEWEASLPAMLQFVSEPLPRRRSGWGTMLLLFWDIAGRAKRAVHRTLSHASSFLMPGALKR